MYNHNFADLWIINVHNGIKEKGIEPINIEDFKAIKKHLDFFYPMLEKRVDKGSTPYNLRNCAYMEDFFRPKIIFQEMVQEPSFILDLNGDYICLDTARIITGENLEVLISVLNSKLFFYAVKSFYGGGSLGDSGIRMKHTFFENFPMPSFPIETEFELIELVNNINNDTLNKINHIIYNFFNLTLKEIEFIEIQ